IERLPVSRWAGATRLQLKHEGMNPTGSFKDRGMTVAVTHALRCGTHAVACASTGNTSSSLAAYAAIAGLRALVLVPDGSVAEGKLAQTLAYGARTLLVRGTFDDCLRLVREAAERLDVYLANSVNPWRVEGQKTIVLELLDQLDWQSPDWIVLPAGNLGNAAAFGKALREAREAGLISRVPRLALVQAEGAAPFARSAATGFAERVRIAEPRTVASAIRIGDPASYQRAVRAMRETNGVVLTATDAEILEAKAVIDASGTGCEPASAASVAGVRRLVGHGTIAPDAHVVALLTGHLLKDPSAALDAARSSGTGPGRGIRIDPDLSEVERVLNDP
ncbi:MAG TPA: threonine synthase, partial [Gemmatimonadaceae bacterium]|nr:threonine synthase [Gemmatimonadaceae bacterium]